MKILVTGSNGFIGKNLITRLKELDNYVIFEFNRKNSPDDLVKFLQVCDAVVHLAGVNRPDDIDEFEKDNIQLTENICKIIAAQERKIRLIFSSSEQVSLDNSYGKSKLAAEKLCKSLHSTKACPVSIFRLPGVFGKWSRPNYNSVVATFCFNVAHNIPIHINDSDAVINLVYIDDVINEFISALKSNHNNLEYCEIKPSYKTTVGDLAKKIQLFKNSHESLICEEVGFGLNRALYSTYISYFLPINFSYEVPAYHDERGLFVEMLKTKNSGQFSFFTTYPGFTRGGHYHHTKTEKFLVIKGSARFSFRNILTNEKYELTTTDYKPQVVQSIPGWVHSISNIGNDEMVVMLWANENFDVERPDTIISNV